MGKKEAVLLCLYNLTVLSNSEAQTTRRHISYFPLRFHHKKGSNLILYIFLRRVAILFTLVGSIPPIFKPHDFCQQ